MATLPDAPDDSDHPPLRTPTQAALLGSDAAWRWFLLGVEYGHANGVSEGYVQAATVLDDAAQALADLKPSRGTEFKAYRARMLAEREPAETLDARHARVAASWDLSPQSVSPWCACGKPETHSPYQPGSACSTSDHWRRKWLEVHGLDGAA